jgi:multidrug efflux pump subunit AcrB
MAIAVALAMLAAYVLAMTFVPCRAANWLRPHPRAGDGDHAGPPRRRFARSQARLDAGINAAMRWYSRRLEGVLRHRLLTIGTAAAVLALVLVLVTPHVRREFFPETDAGAFEIYVRANRDSQTRRRGRKLNLETATHHPAIGPHSTP